MNHTVILGAGSWGTALAALLGQQQDVTLWVRRPELAQELSHMRQNSAYLPGVTLPARVNVTSDLSLAAQQALNGPGYALVVVPSVGVPELLAQLPTSLGIVLCAKGLGPDGQALSTLAAQAGFGRVAVLSGPNHAEEIGRGLPAATVIASTDTEFARQVQRGLHSPTLRVYTSTDLTGVELGGVLKNVVAVAAGMGDGLRLGDNARASVITRGLREMRGYLLSQGAQEATLHGLSGLGDLVATATSQHSRNRAAGEALARGENPLAGGKVVEGLRTAALLSKWATEQDADLPIVQAVNAVATGQQSAAQALEELMRREAKAEE